MSVRRTINSKGEVRWLVREYESGRGSRQICKRFERKIDAENWLSEFNQKKTEKSLNPFSSNTFEERTLRSEYEYWILDGQHRFSLSHTVRARIVVGSIIKNYGEIPVNRISPEFLSKYQQDELKKGLRPATVNRQSGIISAILNHSVRHRRIPFNPSAGFRKLFDAKPEMAFWNSEEAASFLAHVNSKHPINSEKRWVYAVYLLALNTAMRAGEIWGLRVNDVLKDQRLITVKRQFNRDLKELSFTKSKKQRLVPCNASLMLELRNLIEEKRLNGEDLIFRNQKGNPISHDNFIHRDFPSDLKSWGGRQIRFHDLRHTSATLMISRGIDIKTVKEICGHADITTTMNYTHLVSGAVENVALNFSIAPQEKEVSRNLKIVK